MLITGGSSGIGKAIARDAVRQGINVFLVARDSAKLEAAVAELELLNGQCKVSAMSASVTDPDALAVAVRSAETQHGPIDLLVNSAGISVPGYFEDLTIEEFTKQINVNYLGTVWATRVVLPSMKARGQGWIANVSSVAGFKGVFGYTAYCGSKFAVTGFSESLKAEMERFNIGVTLICPPDTRTPMLDGEKASKPEETKRLAAAGVVLEPEEVARAVWSGLRRSKFWITPGRDAYFLRHANRLAPSVVDWMLRRTMRENKNQKGIFTKS